MRPNKGGLHLSGSGWLLSGAALLLLACLFLVFVGPKLFQTLSPQDEGILLVYPDLILRGYVPYRDFAALYTPGTFYVVAGLFALLGESLLVERAVGLVYMFSIAVAIFFVGARLHWHTGLLAALVSIAFLHYFPAIGAYSIFGALALVVFAILSANRSCEAAKDRTQRRLAVLAGGLVGAAFWFRQDVGVIGGVAAAVALCPRSTLRIGSFVAGLSVPALAFVGFMFYVGPVVAFDNIVLDVLRIGPGRRLPLQISPLLVGLALCVLANGVNALLLKIWKAPSHRVALVSAIAVLSAGLMPSALQRADSWHLTYVGSVIAGLTTLSLSVLATRALERHGVVADGRSYWSMYGLVGVVVLVVAATLLVRDTDGPLTLLSVREWTITTAKQVWWRLNTAVHGPVLASGHRRVFATREQLHDASQVIAELNRIASPGQKLFVGPSDLRFSNYNDTFLYFLFPQLRPASRYLEMNPGVANREGSGLAAQIAQADFAILNSGYDRWNEPNASKIPGSSAPNEVISNIFCVHSHHGSWRLLRRCETLIGK